jgi:deoxypyrimidine-specific 5' nucleotidase type C protein (NT5C)
MGLRVGFDLDGVLADMESALIREAEKLFGSSLKRQKTPRGTPSSMSDLVPEEVSDNAPLRHELELTARERRQLWRHVRALDGFWESLEETEPGIVARLATIAAERRWEIIFLTRRPTTAGAISQIQSQRWLEARGFRLPSVYVVTASRGLIAAALMLDIVVDDTPENCVDVASDSKARTIAIFRNQEAPPPPALKAMGIHLVRSTDECLNLLVEIDSSLRQQPGAIERVMRTLGLKQPANV